ncbi:MAG: ferritin-like domain-containing protein, partial [Actinomycetota bacterium]|nr:ferritin-like domain-containing protein [Actinomycetota bacterium]
LGSKAAKKPKFNFKGTNKSAASFLQVSQVLENTGVHAYLGQAANLKNPAFLTAAGTILTIEARHASVIGLINKESEKGIAPDGPFDKPWTANHVLKAVKGTGFIVG